MAVNKNSDGIIITVIASSKKQLQMIGVRHKHCLLLDPVLLPVCVMGQMTSWE